MYTFGGGRSRQKPSKCKCVEVGISLACTDRGPLGGLGAKAGHLATVTTLDVILSIKEATGGVCLLWLCTLTFFHFSVFYY